MININKVKNYFSYFFVSFVPLVVFIIFLISYRDFLISLLASAITIPLMVLLGRKMTEHPIRQMIEGEGLLVLDINSTGIIKPYLAKIVNEKIEIGKIGMKTLFDRKGVFSMYNVQEAKAEVVGDKDNIKNVRIKNEEGEIVVNIKEPKNIFGLQTFYPVILVNSITKTIYNKDDISKFEMKYLIEHNMAYIKRMVEELSSILRDFARYVIEMMRPKKSLLENYVFWIVLIIIIAFMLMIGLPFIQNMLAQQTPIVQPQPQPLIGTRWENGWFQRNSYRIE